jgi:hypothetical protein
MNGTTSSRREANVDFNLVTLSPLHPGWGLLYQGAAVDAGVKELPGPLQICCMDIGEINETYIDHATVESVLGVWINDSPDAVLKDDVYLRLVRENLAWLAMGGHLLVHCGAGVSRASYMTCGLLMAARCYGFQEALADLRAARPVANPNAGFVAHLERLQPVLQTLLAA